MLAHETQIIKNQFHNGARDTILKNIKSNQKTENFEEIFIYVLYKQIIKKILLMKQINIHSSENSFKPIM